MNTAATSAQPNSCYSSLLEYGANHQFNPIMSPVPKTFVPALFQYARPHTIPQIVRVTPCQGTCSGYRQYDRMCTGCQPSYMSNPY